MKQQANLSKIIWTDKNKFNFDESDGNHSYWHYLRKEKYTLYTRQRGGGFLMVWAAFNLA